MAQVIALLTIGALVTLCGPATADELPKASWSIQPVNDPTGFFVTEDVANDDALSEERQQQMLAEQSASEARAIAREMRLDADTEQKLADIISTYETESARLSRGTGLDFRATAAAFGRAYDRKMADVLDLLGAERLRRYQWCTAHLFQLRQLETMTSRLAEADKLTVEQRSVLIELLAAEDEDVRKEIEEFTARDRERLLDPTQPGAVVFHRSDPQRQAARRNETIRQAARVLTKTQLAALFPAAASPVSAEAVQLTTTMQPLKQSESNQVTQAHPGANVSPVVITLALGEDAPVTITRTPSDPPTQVTLSSDLIADVTVTWGPDADPMTVASYWDKSGPKARRIQPIWSSGARLGDEFEWIDVLPGLDRARYVTRTNSVAPR